MARLTDLAPYYFGGRRLSSWPFDDMDFPFSSADVKAAFKMDVEEEDNQYLVSAELPGLTKDNIDVELNDGYLTITAEKSSSEESEKKNYLLRERTNWRQTRSVFLKDPDASKISAKLEDGVLSIVVPKLEEKANATKVTID